RRPRRGTRADNALGRRAQLPGTQLHARPDARRRPGVLLPLQLSAAGHRGPGRGGEHGLSGRDAVRSRERLLRSEGNARGAALVQCRCEAGAQDQPGAAGRTAQVSRTGANASAPAGQPFIHHAHRSGGVEVHYQEADRVVTLQNDIFLRALLREPVPYTPLWLMRQAGRYLPEYRATRQRAGDFLTLCKTPELATEVTLQPLERFPLDAAILFSDILTVPDAMGLGLYFAEGEGPKFERPLRDEAAINALGAPDPTAELHYVMDAVRSIRAALNGRVPLIGFSGSPFTLACYMVEGAGSTDFRHIKALLYRRPDLLHHILDVTATAVTDYLNAQTEAGAQAVMIFDTWGGTLTPHAYREFSLDYMTRILAGLTREADGRRVPSIVFTKGGGLWLEAI